MGFNDRSIPFNMGIRSNSGFNLLKQLEKKIVSCKDVAFKILGFSLATFNTVFSFILSVIMIKNIKNYGKN